MKNKSYIPFLAVFGAILLAVVAAIAPLQSFLGHDVVHAQTIDDATLTALELRTDPLVDTSDIMPGSGESGEFMPTTMEYSIRADSGTNKVTVVPTRANGNASFTIRPSDQDSVTDGHQVLLGGGRNTDIRVTVTSEDRTVTETYTVTVYQVRTSPSDNENLSALTLSGVTLSSRFASSKTSYIGRAEYSTDETTVSYRADIGAMVDIRNDDNDADLPDADGNTDGHQVALPNAGANMVINVVVTAEDQVGEGSPGQKEYKITVLPRELGEVRRRHSGVRHCNPSWPGAGFWRGVRH